MSQSGSGTDETIILSVGVGLTNCLMILSISLFPLHFVRILFCPYHFACTILAATIWSWNTDESYTASAPKYPAETDELRSRGLEELAQGHLVYNCRREV